MNSNRININLISHEESIKNNFTLNVDTPSTEGVALYSDDSLLMVIDKILIHTKALSYLSSENIYMFMKKKHNLSEENIKLIFDKYLIDSEYGTKIIPNERIDILMKNFNIEDYSDLPKKDTYTLNDLLAFFEKISIDVLVEDVPCGFDIDVKVSIVDPLKNTLTYIKQTRTNLNDIFYHYFEKDSELFIVTSHIVYKKVIDEKQSIENTTCMYFPLLHYKEINTYNELLKHIDSNKDKNNERIQRVSEYFKNVDFQISSYQRNNDIIKKSSKNGIRKLEFMYFTSSDVIFPLYSFFKIVHSTKEIPLIKFTPGRRMENMYRLFSKDKTESGEKIPFLEPQEISKQMKKLKKSKCLSFYIIQKIMGRRKQIYLEINEKGQIYFSVEDLPMIKSKDLEGIVQNILNVFIGEIIRNIDQRGKVYRFFTNFKEINNFKIIDLTYEYRFSNENPISVERAEKCFSQFFNVLEKKKNLIRLLYKRVENYNQYSDIDSKIIQLYNKQYSILEIRQAISSEFDLQLQETENKIKEVLMSVDPVNGLKMKYIKENPGFLIEITPQGREYVVLVQNIVDFVYLKFIDVYLNNFILICQNILLDDEVRNFCKGVETSQREDIHVIYHDDDVNVTTEENKKSNIFDYTNFENNNNYNINALNQYLAGTDNHVRKYGVNSLNFNSSRFNQEQEEQEQEQEQEQQQQQQQQNSHLNK